MKLNVPVTAPNPLADLFSQVVFPATILTAQQYGSNSRVLEFHCRLYRYAFKASPTHLLPVLSMLISFACEHFSKHFTDSCIFLGTNLIRLYANEPAAVSQLVILVQAFSQTALARLRTVKDLTVYPDGLLLNFRPKRAPVLIPLLSLVTQDIFGLVSACICNMPELLSTMSFSEMLRMAGTALELSHREALQAVLEFFKTTLTSLSTHLVATAWNENGQRILSGLIKGITVQGYRDQPFSLAVDCLVAAYSSLPEQAVHWFINAVNELPPDLLGAEEKDRWLRAYSGSFFLKYYIPTWN